MTVRALFLSGLVIGLTALLPGPAAARDGTVVVNAPGADDRSVTIRLAELGSPDINNQNYGLPSGNTISGYSLGRVLRAAETQADGWLDLDTLPSVEVDRPSGGPVVLSRTEALGQGDRPPVFYENNGTTVFVMPGSPAREYVFRFTPIGIEAGSAAPFKVSLSFTPGKPARGQAVTITARVTDAPSGSSLSYRWSFSDGSPAKKTSAPRVVHRFRGKGPRSVLVTVQSDGGQEAVDAVAIDVIEGNDRKPDGGGKEGSDTGAGAGSGSGSSGSSGTGIGTGTGSGGSSGSGGGLAPGGSPQPIDAPPKTEAAPRDAGDDLETISGELIGPNATVTELGPEDFATEGAGPTEAEDAGGFIGGAAGEAATVLGIGLLMALGGLLELRVLSRRP